MSDWPKPNVCGVCSERVLDAIEMDGVTYCGPCFRAKLHAEGRCPLCLAAERLWPGNEDMSRCLHSADGNVAAAYHLRRTEIAEGR